MAILFNRPKLRSGRRVVRHVRLGGGTRDIDLGYVGQMLSVSGFGTVRDDLETIEGYTTRDSQHRLTLPLGDGVTRTYLVMIDDGDWEPVGGGIIRFELSCLVQPEVTS